MTELSDAMVVNIAPDKTEVMVVSKAGVVYCCSIKVTETTMEEAIRKHIKHEYNILIDRQTAGVIRTTIGNAYPHPDNWESMDFPGLVLRTNKPKISTINSRQVRETVSEQLSALVEGVNVACKRVPPELAADINARGVVLAGSTDLLKDLDKLLTEKCGLPVLRLPPGRFEI